MYTQQSNILNTQELAFVDNTVLGQDFTWFFQKDVGDVDNDVPCPYMSHTLVHRHSSHSAISGTVNSEYWEFFYPILVRIIGHEPKAVLRANLNLTFHLPYEHGIRHVDHTFEHNNTILYLNRFSGGGTRIYNDTGYTVAPAVYNSAITFAGLEHAQEFCAPGESRCICVYTWI